MEQTPSLSGRSPELPSVAPPSGGEIAGVRPLLENSPGTSLERQEQRSGPSEQAPPATQATALPLPAPVAVTQSDSDDSAQASVVLPTVAADDDLIEKEWVEKAKKVLVETKDDPYRREQEVSRLQKDYLLKRYGRVLGSKSDT